MRVTKVARSKDSSKDKSTASAHNVVVAGNVGEAGRTTRASSRQHVEIVQRDGQTEVREHHEGG